MAAEIFAGSSGVADAEAALAALRVFAAEPVPAPVPGRPEWGHVLLITDKIKNTPGIYPRRAGLPAKKPLGA